MKLLAFTTLLSATSAFMVPSSSTTVARKPITISTTTPRTSSTSTSLASSTEAVAFTQGPRIIRDELPIVYVYDHCPFCVRVRLALGIKNVKHNIHFLQNDDIPTPTKLIGKKIAPIFVSIVL